MTKPKPITRREFLIGAGFGSAVAMLALKKESKTASAAGVEETGDFQVQGLSEESGFIDNQRQAVVNEAYREAQLHNNPRKIVPHSDSSIYVEQRKIPLQKLYLDTRHPAEYGSFADRSTISEQGRRIWRQQEWLPLAPEDLPIFSGQHDPLVYLEIINFFNVDDPANRRYSPAGDVTFCNIFIWDVTRAMNVEIPRWIDGEKTRSSTLGLWLADPAFGERLGWREVNSFDAKDWADKGYPVVASMTQGGFRGHLAMVIPGEGETVDGVFYPNSAQAGTVNFVGRSTWEGFNHLGLTPKYYVNEGPGYQFVVSE